MASGSDTLANVLLPSLLAGKSFTFPTVDLTAAIFQQPGTGGVLEGTITPLTTASLTTGTVGGSGVFDVLMSSLKAHLKEEFTANRLSGAEYSKAYVGIVAAALQTSAQFLLGRDQAYWGTLLVQQQAKIAQAEGVKARLELETARFNFVRAQYEAATTEVNYALTKLKLATEDATYGSVQAQTNNLVKQGVGLDFTNTNILPLQESLLGEQTEVQRAQTTDTRRDTTAITGLVGKQKALYSQQIISYQRDSELKGTKLFTDAWITQKTIDEGLLAPSNFSNANLDVVLSQLRTNLGL